MERVPAELVSQRSDLRLAFDLMPVSMSAVPRFELRDSTVMAVDGRLEPAHSTAVELPAEALLVNATPDLRYVFAADHDYLYVVGPQGRLQLAVPAVDSATPLPGHRAVITADHRVYLIDTDSGDYLDAVSLDLLDAGVMAIPHPHDGSVLLDAGEGQDGSRIFVARVADDRLDVHLILENVVTADFTPLGDRLLVMPHHNFDNAVSIVDWPSREVVSTLSSDMLGIDKAGFDMYGCFLGDGAVLLKTLDNGLVLANRTLDPIAWIDLPGPGEGAEIGALFSLGEQTFAAELWRDGSELATIWRIPPI